ncbi:MAG: U32 family peptidase [Clostridiales bacterium]|nr:U32 family peptidase [Clostridiales bacterium]
MNHPAILAPAGGLAQLQAAVRCGCDAVYLGAKGFNARRNAENFDETTLPEAAAYCHGRGVELYVTVNTMVMDCELDALEETAALIVQAGVDAVILQDMAALRLFRERYPSIRLHASTQTAVHNVDGALWLQEQGFDCIVLARELSLREMEKICRAVDIRTEAFVHGAHCMSVSGACCLSAMLGGRSGNRGLCAQPCRLDWRGGGRSHALSLKDMSLIGHIREMADAGVDYLKIEGRMKRPEYVAAAVTACRNAREGKPYDEQTLRAVFSRSGFTDGYLTGRRTPELFGYRRKEDVTGAEAVLGELAGLYRAETPRVPVQLRFFMHAGAPARLEATDGVRTASAVGGIPETARTRATDAAAAERNLTKTGGTPFLIQSFEAELDDGLMLPSAALNALRREALDGLLTQRSAGKPHTASDFVFSPMPRHAGPAEPAFWARFRTAEQIAGAERLERLERLILPAEAVDAAVIGRFGERLIAELPAVLFPEDEDAFDARLSALRDAGLRAVLTDNIYGIRLGRRLGLTVHGGFGLNIANSQALDYYAGQGLASVTASFELSMERLRALCGTLPRGAMAYGYLPLMRLRVCPLRTARGCSCAGAPALTDRLGVRFPMECAGKRYQTLLNSVPLHIAERDTRGLDYLLLYFTGETPEECARVIGEFTLRQKSTGPRTGGLYYRELL